jgi:ACS family hexuronate transporter-like MFS transporter
MIQSSNISPSFRWKIALLVSAAIAVSYLDRQSLPVAIKAVQNDIPISNTQFSQLNIAFLVTYGLMYAVGGKFLDMVGTRIGFTVCMLFWSVACASHGFATSVTMLVASRLLLGVGEGGGFPAATKAVAEWFPLILAHANWRWVFFVTGVLGLLWIAVWRIFYFVPKQTSTNADPPEVSAAQSSDIPPLQHSTPSWLRLLSLRQTWGIVLAKFLSDAAWYFYLFWLPKYLYDARGLDIKAVAAFAWVPPAAAGLGCLCGGGLSSFLTRGNSVDRARKVALGLSAAVMPLMLFVPRASLAWAIVLFSVAYFGQQWWSTLVMVLPTDIFPRQAVGTIAGLVGFGGAMGGVVFQQVVGYLLDHNFGYGLVFGLAGSFHVIAFAVIRIAIPIIRPLDLMGAPSPKSPIANYQLP